MSQYANTQEVFDASLPYIAWSTDSVTNYLEDKPYGLLKDEEAAKNWKATIKTVVELTPVVKQIPAVMLFVLKVPEWAMRLVSKDLNRVLVMHKVRFGHLVAPLPSHRPHLDCILWLAQQKNQRDEMRSARLCRLCPQLLIRQPILTHL